METSNRARNSKKKHTVKTSAWACGNRVHKSGEVRSSRHNHRLLCSGSFLRLLASHIRQAPLKLCRKVSVCNARRRLVGLMTPKASALRTNGQRVTRPKARGEHQLRS